MHAAMTARLTVDSRALVRVLALALGNYPEALVQLPDGTTEQVWLMHLSEFTGFIPGPIYDDGLDLAAVETAPDGAVIIPWNRETDEVALVLENESAFCAQLPKLLFERVADFKEAARKYMHQPSISRHFGNFAWSKVDWDAVLLQTLYSQAENFNELLASAELHRLDSLPADAAIKLVLANSRCSESCLYLPNIQIPTAVYKDLKDVLTHAGGVWHRNLSAWVFQGRSAEGVRHELRHTDVLLRASKEKKRLGFFATPEELAELLVVCLDTNSEPGLALEPSAGDGTMVRYLAGWNKEHPTHAVELDHERAEQCRELAANLRSDLEVFEEDFLNFTLPLKYRNILMNPPFGKGVELKHLDRALGLLLPHGNLIAIMPDSLRSNSSAAHKALRKRLRDMGATFLELKPGAFKSSGTSVSTIVVFVGFKRTPTIYDWAEGPEFSFSE